MSVVIAVRPTPTHRVTSKFGNRGTSKHWGLDLGASTAGVAGDNIVAVQNGTVKLVKYDSSGYGLYIVVEHTQYGFCTLYAHLSENKTNVGDYVEAGHVIGLMGTTGHSTGVHLHFEIRNVLYEQFWSVSKNTKYVLDPEKYLSSGLSYYADGMSSSADSDLSYMDSYSYTYERVTVDQNKTYLTGNQLYGRKYRIMVFDDNNEGYDVSDLHVVFNVSRSYTRDNTTGTVTIYNLNTTVENKLITDCTRVTIEAGYENLFGLIYDGDVIQGIRGVENGTDYYLTLVAMDCGRMLADGFTTANVPRGASKREVAKTVSELSTVSTQVNSISTAISNAKYIRGKVIFGKTKDYLQQIASQENVNFSVKNGKVNLTSVTDINTEQIIRLDSTSGLIGSPQQNSQYITFQALLNPRIDLNTLVNIPNESIIESQYSDGNAVAYQLDEDSVYRIIQVEFNGDTRGQSWYINATAVSQAGAIPALIADLIGESGSADTLSTSDTEYTFDSQDFSTVYGTNGAKSFKSYMYYQSLTSKSSRQYKLQQMCTTDGLGFRRFRYNSVNYYVCAMGTFYGTTGQLLTITLSSNKTMRVIIGDTKADSETDTLHKYHLHDGSEIEFIVDKKVFPTKSAKAYKSGDCSVMGFEGKISKYKKYENIFSSGYTHGGGGGGY